MEPDPLIVLDTSALVAVLLSERGAEVVRPVLNRTFVSAVNVAETMEVLARNSGISSGDAGILPNARVEPLDVTQAITAGELLIRHRRDNLSLGHACCLALAMSLGADVFTADRSWSALPVPVQIKLIR